MTGAPLAADWTSAIDVVDVSRYDRDHRLSVAEATAASDLARRYRQGPRSAAWTPEIGNALARLMRPLNDVASIPALPSKNESAVRRAFTEAMHATNKSYWAWNEAEWLAAVSDCGVYMRRTALVAAYVVGGQRSLHRNFPGIRRRELAWALFGTAAVEQSAARVFEQLRTWGCSPPDPRTHPVANAVWEMMLGCSSAQLGDFTPDLVAAALDRGHNVSVRSGVNRLAQILPSLGISSVGTQNTEVEWLACRTATARDGVPAPWAEWMERWFLTSTLTRRARGSIFWILMKAGRWLKATHPDCTSPSTWTRTTAASWVAAVDRMRVGDWAHAPSTFAYRQREGNALQARTKDKHIGAMRTFFSDCIEWEWIPRRFDPSRALRTPRSIMALIGPDPRVIGDAVWVKLLWAGLNLTADDLRLNDGRLAKRGYPLELVRAITLLWLFSGLRINEIVRLRTGCIRWQHPDGDAVATSGGDERVCLLDVPVNKTGSSFTKPVDSVVGDAVGAWENVRGRQPRLVDHKTGEAVDFLFSHRALLVSVEYVNNRVIPMLCHKANVPITDARGRITTHRARSTIASQLYNAKDPMTLFKLQAWLGHRSPASTQHYARITPTTLTAAYKSAGYFERNVRAIKVLLDRDAVTSGAVATGAPWQHYDLGHGYCNYNYFEQCPHRMACARCDFYVPKSSAAAQLLEAKTGLQRMPLQIPLTDEERAAVDDDQSALARLLERLAGVATPAGPPPNELASRLTLVLPIVAQPANRPDGDSG